MRWLGRCAENAPRPLLTTLCVKGDQMKSLIFILLFTISGCAGVGLVATSNPDVKIQQAYRMMNEGRALMAEDLIRQAMVIYKKENNILGIAEAYHTYGNLYKHSSYHNKKPGTFDRSFMKSVSNYEMAKTSYEQVGDEVGAVKSLIGMGNAYHLRNEDNKACGYYSEALSRYNSGKENGVITKEPVILDKRYKNIGDVIIAFKKREKCNT